MNRLFCTTVLPISTYNKSQQIYPLTIRHHINNNNKDDITSTKIKYEGSHSSIIGSLALLLAITSSASAQSKVKRNGVPNTDPNRDCERYDIHTSNDSTPIGSMDLVIRITNTGPIAQNQPPKPLVDSPSSPPQ